MRDRRPHRPAVATLLALVAAVAISPVAVAARTAPPLPSSRAGADVVQPQPPAGTCHERGAGLYSLPDAHCTPGALNPDVRQSTLSSTICKSGWSSTVRPPASITAREKRASLAAYGDGSSPFEYDHLVSLELGGAVNDARNLWPEPDYATKMGFYLNPKDRLERVLNGFVCRGSMRLAQAQRLIASDWVAAYRKYLSAPAGSGAAARRHPGGAGRRGSRSAARRPAPSPQQTLA